VNGLRGLHAGEPCTVVGTGPSILRLRAADFGPGPVIALNHAVLALRPLRLPNRLYTMQKDGCTPHGGRRGPVVEVPIRRCVCPSPRTVEPLAPEVLVLSAAESSRCFARYPLRHVVDVERDLGMAWCSMSAPVAVRLAAAMGCASLRMLGFDAYTLSDARRIPVRGVLPGTGLRGYRHSAVQALAHARALGLPVEWG
jgi:hypothetical protein